MTLFAWNPLNGFGGAGRCRPQSVMSSHDPQDVAAVAYDKWLSRGGLPGTELQDWLEAEAELGQVHALAERLRAEEELQETEQRFRQLAENIREVFWMVDARQPRMLYISPAYEELWGRSCQSLYEHPLSFLDAVHPEDQGRVRACLHRQVQGENTKVEYRVIRPDGSVRWVWDRGFPIKDPRGEVYRVAGIAEDITAQKLAERRQAAEHAVTRVLAESASISAAARRIIQTVCESLGWNVGAIWNVDPRVQVLRCVEFWSSPAVQVAEFEALCRQRTFLPGIGLPGRVWANREPAWIPDVTQDTNFPRAPVAARVGLHGAFGFPIRSGERILGVIEFFSQEIRQPDEPLLHMMNSIGSQIGQFIERRRAERVLEEREQELRVARRIQEGLIPRTAPVIPGFAVAGRSCPANSTGGDYFDFLPLPDGSLGFVIADASGHGVGPALLMAETRAFLRALALSEADPGRILTLANRRLAEDVGADRFVTLFLARLDPRSRSWVYSSAGHVPGTILDRHGQVVAKLPSTAIPLGIDANAAFATTPARVLAPGELVLLHTDGIVDARSAEEKPFGIERALEVVGSQRDRPPGEIMEALFHAVCEFARGHAQIDDMTAVILKAEIPG